MRNKARIDTSLDLWQRYGESLLVVQPFMDSLIVRGEGCFLIDADDRRILDLAAGQFCSILGHGHRRFSEYLHRQLDALVHLGDQYVAPVVLTAASRLAGIAPGSLDKVVFLSTGSEANECAMRMAKAVTGRSGMLGLTRGYYGISLATRNLSSISDHPLKSDFQPVPANQHKLLAPACNHCPLGQQYPACNTACLDVSMEISGQHLTNTAAVIIEPVLSAGGMIFPPREYVEKLAMIARKAGALFIVDEAQTGFGRCGEWFDIQNYGIEPDILVVSKTAGNGYPAAAVVVSDSVARALEEQCFTHLSSHQNDPLAAATVQAVIDIVEEDNLIDHSRTAGRYFLNALVELKHRHPLVSDVRGRGLMIAMELLDSREHETIALHLALLCERRGLHITFSYFEPVIRFIPPLIINHAEIDQAISILDEALTVLEGQPARLADVLPQNCRSGPFIKTMVEGNGPAVLLRKMWDTSPQQWFSRFRARSAEK
jgi:2,2-dialkylglycine decarboxylase (pyruvate)